MVLFRVEIYLKPLRVPHLFNSYVWAGELEIATFLGDCKFSSNSLTHVRVRIAYEDKASALRTMRIFENKLVLGYTRRSPLFFQLRALRVLIYTRY